MCVHVCVNMGVPIYRKVQIYTCTHTYKEIERYKKMDIFIPKYPRFAIV